MFEDRATTSLQPNLTCPRVSGEEEGSEKSSCSPTRSTAISSAKISMPHWRCCTPAAIACISRRPWTADRPLCCGRTFLSVGKVDEARREAERTLAALVPYVERGVPVIGLEPSCILELSR